MEVKSGKLDAHELLGFRIVADKVGEVGIAPLHNH